jgi:hypothetical protein
MSGDDSVTSGAVVGGQGGRDPLVATSVRNDATREDILVQRQRLGLGRQVEVAP